jgi:hypothetical protein
MLSGLARRFRVRAAITLAAFYTVCVIAPAAALAFVHGPSAIHCLTSQHGLASPHNHDEAVHVHADGTVHRHHDSGGMHEHADADGKAHPADCCGLFCMTAAGPHAAASLFAPVHFTFAGPPRDDDLAGRDPDRINRPPIA